MKLINFIKPKVHFEKELFCALTNEASSRMMTKDEIDEMAIPSYLHKNPLIRWIVFKRLQSIVELIDINSDDINLLDFGCGTGILNLQWKENSLNYIGVDLITWPAEFILSQSGRRDFNILQAEKWDDSVDDASLDYIICLEVLEHLSETELEDLLIRFSNKLKTTGYLVVAGPTESFFYRLMRQVAGFSGSYHHNNITKIRKTIKSQNYVQINFVQLPIPGVFTLFEIIKYEVIKNTN